MKEEYISISEFAKRAGVSHQSIYKRLHKDLQPWLQEGAGGKKLNIKALDFFETEKSATGCATNCATDSTEVATIKLLQKTVELLEKELTLKNTEIAELHARLKESHVLLDQQQHLQAAGLLEEKTVLPASVKEEELQTKKWWQFWRRT